jgi:hypothetical protein
MKGALVFGLVLYALSLIVSAQPTDKTAAAIKLMDRQWIVEAYSSKDLKDFDRIVADDAVFTNGLGKITDKKAKREGVARDYTDPSTRLPADVFMIEPSSHVVRIFDKTAISTGYVAEDYMWKTQHIKNRVYFTNTYLKRKGKWQLVASHYTNVKQP